MVDLATGQERCRYQFYFDRRGDCVIRCIEWVFRLFIGGIEHTDDYAQVCSR